MCCCARRTATAAELSIAATDAAAHTSVHEFDLLAQRGGLLPLRSLLTGKVALIVNTASACGLTPQFEGLQRLQEKYEACGFTVLGVPCNQFFAQEKGDDASIAAGVCKKYAISFPVAAKVDVNGAHAHPLYKWMKAAMPAASRPGGGAQPLGGLLGCLAPLSAFLSGTPLHEVGRIEHNFAKFLVDGEGRLIRRYLPPTRPEELEPDILAALAASGGGR
jgi:glutathione peroxidase